MTLWAELNEAWHSINGYGGNTAEIYSYRFQRYSPMAHGSNRTETGDEKLKSHYRQAASSLVDLVELFCTIYDCNAAIDNMKPNSWKHEIDTGLREYSHRAHVKIER